MRGQGEGPAWTPMGSQGEEGGHQLAACKAGPGAHGFPGGGKQSLSETSPGGPGREMQRRSPGILTSEPLGSEGPSFGLACLLSYQV